jgi:hypothetical protein
LANEAIKAAAHFTNTSVSANTHVQYVIDTASGNNTSGFGTQFCAYHSSTTFTTGDIAYTNMPYITDAGASCGASSAYSRAHSATGKGSRASMGGELGERACCASRTAGSRASRSSSSSSARPKRAAAARCNACPVKAHCTESQIGRHLFRSFFQDVLDRAEQYRETEAFRKAMRKRQVWPEPIFGEAKQWHGLRRFRLRGLVKVNIEGVLIASGQNLKRLPQYRSCGLRPLPGGAAHLVVGQCPPTRRRRLPLVLKLAQAEQGLVSRILPTGL